MNKTAFWGHLLNAVKYYSIELPRTVLLLRFARLSVFSSEDTIAHILSTRCSVSRFGDGEFAIAFGESIYFQKVTPELQEEIRNVLATKQNNLLVCIPHCLSVYGHGDFRPVYARAWDRLALMFVPKIITLLGRRKDDMIFGDANISRPYMIFKNRMTHAKSIFDGIKGLWFERDILIVEGEESRLGVGNDLFDGAKSIRRVVCPATNAYNRIDEIEDSVVRHVKGALVLMALGPTATVLAARLSRRGIQAIDIGHVDVEYMWYKMGAKEKVAIPGRYVHEASGHKNPVPQCVDPDYVSSIVDKIL